MVKVLTIKQQSPPKVSQTVRVQSVYNPPRIRKLSILND